MNYHHHHEKKKKQDYQHRVFIAVGSNLGDRYANIQAALKLLCRDCVARIDRTSFLRETAPMYVTDQPAFLNGALTIETNLKPHDLLRRIKNVEQELGRDLTGAAVRNGPRPVDLDILLYQTRACRDGETNTWTTDPEMATPDLIVPHPRIAERTFVLDPLQDIVGRDFVIDDDNNNRNSLNETVANLLQELSSVGTAVRVLPLPRGRMLYFNETIVMGILNVTPDSFSDGGQWTESVQTAVTRALEMEQQGAKIIDIGGESTRPGAEEVAEAEEIRRTVPVIQALRAVSDIVISVDTRNANVAQAAIQAGADVVNDVSGGAHDPAMLATVAALGVPMILMHMRGTPQTMQSMTEYEDVVIDVGKKLVVCSEVAAQAGIYQWAQVIDPGIGFAKDLQGNLLLLQRIPELREYTSNLPILIGTSRKGFLGRITGVEQAADRDYASVASIVAALSSGEQLLRQQSSSSSADIVRVHNVKAARHAVQILDAIKNAAAPEPHSQPMR